ncbi:acyltransferase [Butyrivibrio sp. INlla16]|uniref:acyltransferase family protein n=1 Tax=Butyrivibrio sp. INlla16 TaxID=1520807 RepID=UPI000884CAE5|nr:acyltransferase [Butyrivibrio sp. INlla16]SDB62972.1 Fucose 4-O-acetylase [Butyrivibrio sp. INlla16]
MVNEIRKNNIKDHYNYGIQLLRMIMCIGVVIIHCADERTTGFQSFIYFIATNAVGTFMLIAFYFNKKVSDMHFDQLVKKRISRIYLPVIIWAFIYSVIKIPVGLIDKEESISLFDFVWQIMTGHDARLNPAMWFQLDLLMLTVLYWLYVNRLRTGIKTKEIILVASVLVFVYLLQYLGINAFLFGLLRFELRYPIGRVIEMVPFAIIGSLAAYVVDNNLVNIKRYSLLAIVVICLIYMLRNDIGINPQYSFGYAGGEKLIVATALFILFSSADSLIMKGGSIVKGIVYNISKYTLGIYSMHIIVNKILCAAKLKFKFPLEKRTIVWSLLVYVTCYAISWISCKIIPDKYTKYIFE